MKIASFIFEAVSAEFIKITFAKQLFFIRHTPDAKFESFEYSMNNSVEKHF